MTDALICTRCHAYLPCSCPAHIDHEALVDLLPLIPFRQGIDSTTLLLHQEAPRPTGFEIVALAKGLEGGHVMARGFLCLEQERHLLSVLFGREIERQVQLKLEALQAAPSVPRLTLVKP